MLQTGECVDDRHWPVLLGIRAILQPALDPTAETSPGAETVSDAEWVRSLVERARLEVLPYGRRAPEFQQLHTQLMLIEHTALTNVDRARRLIAALLASLPAQPGDKTA